MEDPVKPFSSEWYATSASRRAPKRVGTGVRRQVVMLFSRRQGTRSMPMLALVLLVLASSFISRPQTSLHISPEGMSRSDLAFAAVPTVPPVSASISTGGMSVQPGWDHGPVSSKSTTAHTPASNPTATPDELEGTLLPSHRILLVYGLPGDPAYGMLASYDNLRLLEFLRAKANEFESLEPGRPVKLGVQLIASAAQKTPGADGSYLRDTSVSVIYQYIEFTRANDMLLILDVQVGRRTVPQEVQRVNQYLLQPHVHLAIDPEFDVGRTEIPTQDIGSTTAADIRWTQDYLANMVLESGIPPKILIVHQWTEDMIVNRPLLRPVRGVQLVINVSIWGSVEEKTTAYTSLVADEPVEFGGIMISGAWDSPPMGTEDIINLPQAPEIVMYQ